MGCGPLALLTEVVFTFRELRLASIKEGRLNEYVRRGTVEMEETGNVFAKGGKRVNTRHSAGFRSGRSAVKVISQLSTWSMDQPITLSQI